MIGDRAKRGPKYRHREPVVARANEMREAGERVNKSRIARELHIPLRTVFRVLSRAA